MTEENTDLQELEPLEAPTPEPGAPDPSAAPRAAPGLPAPAFNPAADKEYYRFLFAGVVMFVGCMMPFGPDWNMNGYKTLSGALFTVISVGMIWSWWGAIATGRFSGKNLKWVGLALLPLVVELINLIGAFDAPAVKAMRASGEPMPDGWRDFFSAFFDVKNPDAQLKADNFVRGFGSGKIVLFLGAVLAELSMLLAVFGGAKTARAQKAQRMANSAAKSGRERRR
jgi:hypothetical protein